MPDILNDLDDLLKYGELDDAIEVARQEKDPSVLRNWMKRTSTIDRKLKLLIIICCGCEVQGEKSNFLLIEEYVEEIKNDYFICSI